MEANITQILKDIKNILKDSNARYLSLKEVSEYTSMSQSTIRRAVDKGHLKSSNTTGKILFKITEIERWLNG